MKASGPKSETGGAGVAADRAMVVNKPKLLDKWEIEEVTLRASRCDDLHCER